MTIEGTVETRGIQDILHFTRNAGLVGVLASRKLKSREELPQDLYLEYVYEPNCEIRNDTAWLGYVNLSISRINSNLFNIASGKWHAESGVWWCILSFETSVLGHEGVLFSTTNNMYSGTLRGGGAPGLDQLFSDRVHLYENRYECRIAGMPQDWTTCPQAEVLYPGTLSTEFLKTVYVATGEHQDIVSAQLQVTGTLGVRVEVRPEKFR